MFDLESLTHFWIETDHNDVVTGCSNAMSKYIDKFTDLKNQISFKQPVVSNDRQVKLQLENKIIIFQENSSGLDFRSTFHQDFNKYYYLCWPVLKSLTEANKLDFQKYLKHPACHLADTLILKDVLEKSQEKIHQMSVKSLEQDLELQKKINFHQSKLASLGELSAGIGHEINNPLQVVMGNFDILEKTFLNTNDEKMLDRINTIHIALKRIKEIVGGLRIYSRTNEDKVSNFEVGKSLKESISLIDEIYRNLGIKVTTSLICEDVYVQGIPGEFQQVLLNLLGNARDALEDIEGKTILITMKKSIMNKIEIEITDNGKGMDKDTLEKALTPFFTTKKVGKGTGLGMSITYDIIKKMKGELNISSKLGSGTTIKISLPLVEGVSNEKNKDQVDNVKELKTDSISNGISFTNHRALVLDDEEDLLEIIEYKLQSFGIHVDTFCKGSDAVKAVEANDYDIIFTDMMMSEMSGKQFVEKIRKLDKSLPPIFLMTGGVLDKSDVNSDFIKSFDGVIYKPFDNDDLIKALQGIESLKAS